MGIGLIVGIVAVVFVLIVILLYNSLVRLRNQVRNSWSQIDVQLKRRNDLIPNLVETVKGYMEHEREVLENVTKARSAILAAKTTADRAQASNMISDTLKSLFAVAENYPDLKANESFLQLQEELTGTENKIAYSRQHYNDMVLVYNTRIEQFPGNIFARMFNFVRETLFEARAEERKNVEVKF